MNMRFIYLIILTMMLSSCSLYYVYLLDIQKYSSGHLVMTTSDNKREIRSYSIQNKENILKSISHAFGSDAYKSFEVKNDELFITFFFSQKTLSCIQKNYKHDINGFLNRVLPSTKLLKNDVPIHVKMIYLDEQEFDLTTPYDNVAYLYFPHNYCQGESFPMTTLKDIRRVYHEVTHLLQRDDAQSQLESEKEASLIGLCYALMIPAAKGYKFNKIIVKNTEKILVEFGENKRVQPIHYYSSKGAILAEKHMRRELDSYENEINTKKQEKKIKYICSDIFQPSGREPN